PPLADQLWLEEVSLWLTPEERAAFAELETEAERDLWRRDFWRRRDPVPEVLFHPRKEQLANHLRALRLYGFSPGEERGQLLLLHGLPMLAYGSECATAPDATPSKNLTRPVGCIKAPVHQFYDFGPSGSMDVPVLFVAENGYCRLYDPQRQERFVFRLTGGTLCSDRYGSIPYFLQEAVENPVSWDEIRRKGLSLELLHEAVAPLSSAQSGEPRLEVTEFQWDPERGSTVILADLVVPVARDWRSTPLPWRLLQQRTDVYRSGQLLLQADTSTRISADPGGELRLRWDMRLQPGTYDLVLHIEDEQPHLFTTTTFRIEVPAQSRNFPRLWTSTIETSEPNFRLAPLPGLQTGTVSVELLRFSQDVQEVQYFLDDRLIAAADRPPFTADIDLGALPLERKLEARASDRDGATIARDNLTVNASLHRFAVELEDLGDIAEGELRLTARARVPHGRLLKRLTLFLGDEEVARTDDVHLSYRQRLDPGSLDRGEVLLASAVAELEDGARREGTKLLSAGASEEVDVELVEIFAGVRSKGGQPLLDLAASDFTVRENGRPQSIESFRRVDELPLHVALLLDTSGSMTDEMGALRKAALEFLDQILRPEDRAALIPFTDRAYVLAPFTDRRELLRAAASTLLARGGTSLLNSTVQSLHYLREAPGKRALILVSDGIDRDSTLTYDEVLDYATRVDAAVYTIGLGVPGRAVKFRSEARRLLRGLAESTGGRYFPLDARADLSEIFAAIETDLRSQYQLTYESDRGSGAGFRKIQVDVDRKGSRVQARPGYYP
ncbi:MAG: VWA domain-containing protein, partial [Acidobacteriota bacterium]